MIYLMANHSSVWGLRDRGQPMGWLIGHEGWRSVVKGDKHMPYALDNGMYHPIDKPAHGANRLCEFFGRCGKALESHDPLFAVVPDVPYMSEKTMKSYTFWIKQCRRLAPTWRWGIAVQDGMVPSDLDRLSVGVDFQHDCVCVGGSSEWKDKTIGMWAKWCRESGVWCHVLRVNGESRLRLCQDEGVNSVDGTGIFSETTGAAGESDVGVESTGNV
jgi:hypothetical protein